MILKISGKEKTVNYFIDCLRENIRLGRNYRSKEFNDKEFFVDVNIK